MSETFPHYDYKRYLNDIFPPYTDPNKIEGLLHKIGDLILVAKFEPVGDDDDDDCMMLFKGQTVADLSGVFPFPSEVFFDLKKSQIIDGLRYNSKPVRVIKPENCYSSIEQYLNRVVAVENSAADNIVEDVADKYPKADVVAKNAIETIIDDKDLPTPKSPSKKLITNRQLNFTLSPVDTYNAKEMPYKLQNHEIDGTWNHHQSIILDVILDRIFYIAYQEFKKPPLSWRSKKAMEVVEKFSGGRVNPEFISYMNLSPIEAFVQKNGFDFREKLKEEYNYKKDQMGQVSFEKFVENYLLQNQDYQEFIRTVSERVKGFYSDYFVSLNPIKLLETYPLLEPYRYKLIEYLKKIEQTRFKMIYKVKYMQRKPIYDEKNKLIDKGELIDLNYRMNEFQQLFEVVTAQKDEIVLNFKSPLGKFIIHNMLILDTDWCPVKAMSLSKNAYFIYKRFIFKDHLQIS